MIAPDYKGACISNLIPAVFARRGGVPGWLPAALADARQVVVLVLDGLGWDQLRERESVAPTLAKMEGQPGTSVVPSTTATALTSITTGRPPSEHGVVGYRLRVQGDDVLNVLRWRAGGRPADDVDPELLQPWPPFAGRTIPVVTRAEFEHTGFTVAHLRGGRLEGWRMPSTLPVQVARLLREGEEVVYAYYDGVDKVAHEFGLGDYYEAELSSVDGLVAAIVDALPAGAALVVTSDHGQVDVGDRLIELSPNIARHASLLSGEGRFLWIHTKNVEAVVDAARAEHGDVASVHTRTDMITDGWFGGPLAPEVRKRLGDVALVATEPVAFFDPADPGSASLVSRHGSVTAAEMRVPLIAAFA